VLICSVCCMVPPPCNDFAALGLVACTLKAYTFHTCTVIFYFNVRVCVWYDRMWGRCSQAEMFFSVAMQYLCAAWLQSFGCNMIFSHRIAFGNIWQDIVGAKMTYEGKLETSVQSGFTWKIAIRLKLHGTIFHVASLWHPREDPRWHVRLVARILVSMPSTSQAF